MQTATNLPTLPTAGISKTVVASGPTTHFPPGLRLTATNFTSAEIPGLSDLFQIAATDLGSKVSLLCSEPYISPSKLLKLIQGHHQVADFRKLLGETCPEHAIPLYQTSEGVYVVGLLVQSPLGEIHKIEEVAETFHQKILGPISNRFRVDNDKVEIILLSHSEFVSIRQGMSRLEGQRELASKIRPGIKMDEALEIITSEAVRQKTSDIHIEPIVHDGQKTYRIRFRVDGNLSDRHAISAEEGKSLVGAIRAASKAPAETRVPVDGNIEFSNEASQRFPNLKGITLRVSIVPTGQGHSAVLRVLAAGNQSRFDLDRLGLQPLITRGLREVALNPNGLVLVTGPTGSGKTTTLYSILSYLNDGERKILTAEDPVECQIPGLTQVPIDVPAKLTFDVALRSFLRQDPDVILVGEIRDAQTAAVSMQAALSGHLVFATLHTNDSFSTLPRLFGYQVGRSELHDTLRAVFAQRLVAAVCPDCREQFDAKDDLNAILGKEVFTEPLLAFRPKASCCGDMSLECCGGTGYVGRTVIPELWIPGREERGLIVEGVTKMEAYLEAARRNGASTLLENALDAIRRGDTTIEECLRGIFSINNLRENLDIVRTKLGKAN